MRNQVYSERENCEESECCECACCIDDFHHFLFCLIVSSKMAQSAPSDAMVLQVAFKRGVGTQLEARHPPKHNSLNLSALFSFSSFS